MDLKYLKVWAKRAICHTFRHSFPTHLFESGYDIQRVRELLGQNHVNATPMCLTEEAMVYVALYAGCRPVYTVCINGSARPGKRNVTV